MNTGDVTQAPPAVPASRAADEKSKAKLQKAVREFESLFVGYMLRSMRSSMKTDEMFGESYGGDMMDGLVEMEMARHMSQNSSLGMAEMLYRGITGEDLPRQSSARPAVAPKIPAAPKTETGKQMPALPSPAPVPPTVQKESVRPATVQATPPTGAVSDTLKRRLDVLTPHINEAADTLHVNANLLRAMIATESGGRNDARSAKNAKGVMQLIDSTAAAMGVTNVWDPRENILGGAKYLQQMMTRFEGDMERALASYNAGPGAVEKHGGIPPYKETRAYVTKVLNYLRLFEGQELDHGRQD